MKKLLKIFEILISVSITACYAKGQILYRIVPTDSLEIEYARRDTLWLGKPYKGPSYRDFDGDTVLGAFTTTKTLITNKFFDNVAHRLLIDKPGRNINIHYVNAHFTDTLLINCDVNMGDLILENCIFIRPVTIRGRYRNILIKRCLFLGTFTVGSDSIPGVHVVNDMAVEYCEFNDLVNFSNIKIGRGTFQRYNRYTESNIQYCSFQRIHDVSNLYNGEFTFQFNQVENARYNDCLFKDDVIIFSSVFNGNAEFLDCKSQKFDKTTPGFAVILNSFKKQLVFNSCVLSQLYLSQTFFLKDSSAFSLTGSEVGEVNIGEIAFPYILDLSNLSFLNNGGVHINYSRKWPTYQGTEIINRKEYGNDNTYLYLDRTNVDKVDFQYDNFILASIYYDPSIQDYKQDQFYKPTHTHKHRYFGSADVDFKSHQILVGKDILATAYSLPFTDNIWRKKDLTGINNKDVLYRILLKKFHETGDTKSYEKLDMEFQRFKLLELSPSTYNKIVFYSNKYWWAFGYKKELIFLWMTFFLIVFSLINVNKLGKLNNNAYKMDKLYDQIIENDQLFIAGLERESEKVLQREPVNGNLWQKLDIIKSNLVKSIQAKKHLFVLKTKYLSIKFLHSLIYTGLLFLGLRMDASKFTYKNFGLTFWILFIYAVGIICLGFVANIILN